MAETKAYDVLVGVGAERWPRWTRGPVLPLLLLGLVIALVQPWVDAPVNDDWQYARAAKLLAETGTLTIDTPIAPSIVVQSYIGAGLVGLFGYSHVALRLLTIALAALGLVCLERTLRFVGAARLWTVAACALVVVNPIALHLTTSYLSEWYGFVFALLAVLLWFRVRSRRLDDQALPLWLYLAVALLTVLAFWSRQFTVLVYPALVASRALPVLRAGLRARRLELLGALLGTCVVTAGVLGYFAWARATGNYKPQFATPVAALLTFSLKTWLMQCSACLAYMSASFAPLLLLARAGQRGRRGLLIGVGCVLLMLAGLLLLQVTGGQGFIPDRPLNARFPYVNNIIYPTGVGPVTLTDVYVQRSGTRPNWSGETTWLYVEYAVLLSTALWGVLATSRSVQPPSPQSGARRELAAFALLWLLGSLSLSIQAYQTDVFDRYYFPCILALALLVPALLTSEAATSTLSLRAQVVPAGLAFLLLSWFAVAGVHDYFRWNEARLELYVSALKLGASTRQIDAGYELNGWHNLEAFTQRAPMPAGCIGPCFCQPWSWYCDDNSYRVLMSDAPAGYRELARAAPRYWLAEGPALRLVQRE